MARKKKEKSVNPAGNPPFYKTVEELQLKVDEYFKFGHRKRMIKGVETPMLTITGLVLYLGFCNRASFYDYEKRSKFSHTMKKARTFIEQEYEELLRIGNPAGAIFALKNFDWHDKQEHSIPELESIGKALAEAANRANEK